MTRHKKDRRVLRDFPNHFENLRKGKYKENTLTFDQLIDKNFNNATEERPTALRSNIVEKYLRQILNRDLDPALYEEKLNIVKKMIELRIDNRVLNQMRQTMNESIEDERGLMSKDDF